MFLDGLQLPNLQDQDIVFDLDGTLINGDMGESVFLHLHLKDLLDGKLNRKISLNLNGDKANPGSEIIAHYLQLFESGQHALAYQYTAEVIARYPSIQIREAVNEILDRCTGLQQLQINFATQEDQNTEKASVNFGAAIRPSLQQFITSLKDQGSRLWIISASPQSVVDACGEIFGFPADNIFGADISPAPSGNKRFPWKSGKAEVLKEHGVRNPLLVFGNGLEDLDMLKLAQFPVVMEDGHPGLVAHARDWGWSIYKE